MTIYPRHPKTFFGLPPRELGFAWVYVLTTNIAKNIAKIGCAVDMASRFDRIKRKRQLDYDFELHCAYRLPWRITNRIAERIESSAHRELARLVIPGSNDWFFITPMNAESAILRAVNRHQITDVRRFPTIIVNEPSR